jgi:hypothetical protein
MKRELHTLYIKHDSQFKTLSKIALSQLILKIVYIKGDGTFFKADRGRTLKRFNFSRFQKRC